MPIIVQTQKSKTMAVTLMLELPSVVVTPVSGNENSKKKV